MNLSRVEQETIVCFNAEEENAEIYTCNPSTIRKLQQLSEEQPEYYKLVKQDEISVTYSCPKNLINFRKKKVYTDEQRQVMAERLSKVKRSTIA